MPGPIERVVSCGRGAAGLFVLHLAPDGPQSRLRLAKEMTWKGSTTWSALGNMTVVDGGRGGRTVPRSKKRFRSFQGWGCLSIQPATSVFLRGREDLDDLVVLHVGDAGGVLCLVTRDESITNEVSSSPMARGAVQSLAIGGQEGPRHRCTRRR